MAEDRKEILGRLSRGEISVEEAEALLDALGEREPREIGRKAAQVAKDIGASVRDALKPTLEELSRGLTEVLSEVREGVQEFGGHIGYATPDTADLRDAGEETLEFALGAGRLEVKNAFGNVSVSEAEGDTLTLRAHRWAKGATDDEAREQARQVEVHAEQEDNGVEVKVRGEGRLMRRVRVHLEIGAPAGVKVEVKGVAGKIECRGLSGEVEAKTVSGEIALRALRGKASAHAVSGMVTAEALEGGMEARTLSGQITARDCEGPVRLKTVSGMIAASGRGEVNAKSVSGMIRLVGIESEQAQASNVSGAVEIEFAAPFSGDLNVKTVSGPVEVRLPKESDCKVEVSGGHTTLDPALPLASVESGHRRLTAVLGSGKGAIEIKTVSGAVRLAARGS